MPPSARTPRDRWVAEGLRALADGGPGAVRVDSLAKTIGVTRGGFYWHFDDRAALLEEMLDEWERISVDEAIQWVERAPGNAGEKLRRLFALAAGSRELLKIDLAVRDWARREKPVARRLRRVDNRRMEYMRSLFGELCADEDEVEVRCLLAFSLFVGSHFTRADHGPRSRQAVLELALARLTSPTFAPR